MNLVVKEDTISSLELLKEINFWRVRESENSEKEKSELQHNDLLKIIRDEFEEEISLGKISQSEYTNTRGRKYPMFSLKLNQAKRVLLRESKFVRKSVIAYIDSLENEMRVKDSSEWKIARHNGKLMRRKETDIIQEKLIPLAIEQGSKNYSKLYMTYSRLVNSACGVLANTRAEMTPEMLIYIGFLESMIENCIIEEVEKETNYKEIYQICKIKCEQLKVIKSVPKLKYINQDKILGLN